MRNSFKLRNLSIAALVGLASMGVAHAATIEEIDLSQKPLDTPTLDYLHDNGVTYEVENADGTTSTLDYPKSSYTLTETTDSSLDNVITKYVYDETNATLTEKYYQVSLKQTEYGTGDSTKYYKWTTNSYTDFVSTDSSNAEITALYDSTTLSDRIDVADGVDYGNITNSFVGQENKAIYNQGTVGDITGTFIGNYHDPGTYRAEGGAIHNESVPGSIATIGNITGDFIGNYSEGYMSSGYSGSPAGEGGAIYNYAYGKSYSAVIGDITGNFIGNSARAYALGSSAAYPAGGAIYNSDNGSGANVQIGNITGNFIGNYVYSYGCGLNGYGGAIYNRATMGNVTGDFIGNYVYSYSYRYGASAYGGAIYNMGTIGDITGDFIGNYIKADPGSYTSFGAYGGAIYNTGTIGDITGNFINNYALSLGEYTSGGAIYNQGQNTIIGDITGDFINNHVSLVNKSYIIKGGAIYNTGTIGNITGDFTNNYLLGTSSVYGGAISNYKDSSMPAIINSISGDFIGNYAETTSGTAYGGAIYHSGTLGAVDDETGRVTGGLVNTSFINNYAKSETGKAYGGAIYTTKNLNLTAKDGYTSVISGNYVEDVDGKRNEFTFLVLPNQSETSVYYDETNKIRYYTYAHPSTEPLTLSFTAENGGKFVINDKITGTPEKSYLEGHLFYKTYDSTNKVYNYTYVDEEYNEIETPELIPNLTLRNKLELRGDKSGVVQINNDVEQYDIKVDGPTLHLAASPDVLASDNLTFNLGALSMVNNQVGVANFNTLTLNGNIDFIADVDLANAEMDRFTTPSYTIAEGANLNVIGMNILTNMPDDKDKTEIFFAEQGLKDSVTNGISDGTGNLPTSEYQVIDTPIYRYNAQYDNREDGGYFVFTKGHIIPEVNNGSSNGTSDGSVSTGNPSDAFNPAVLGGSTSASVGAVGTMNQTFNYAFQNSADFMNIPYLERISMKNRNKYALSITGDATDMGRFSPLYQPSDEEASVWVKPYATFETVGLKNGPKVHNNTYGTLVGFDTEMQSLKHGWDRVITGYIGYNGASQRYSGVDSTQNGGLIGGTVTMYKGNFFNATTVSVGANVAQNQTMYGKDDFAMLLSGVGNKTGYNFEFKEGKLILQPSMLMSYTFVNTFDYTNAAGVRIDNKPLHALQLAPGVKVIGNLKNGWQPYASVSMVWNLMGESDATANGVKLPEMSIKPYVQYGVGVQKRIKDHFTAYGQAMIQNGGRNGISLTGGFRWALGHDKCKYEEQKVERVNDKSKTLSLGEGANSSKKIIKQMTPEQRMALGGKYQNTSRTAKSGNLRQL